MFQKSYNVVDPMNIIETEPEPESEPESEPKIEIETETKTDTDIQRQAYLDFQKTIQEYILTNKPKLCILTPCYGGLCHVNYTMCLIETIHLFQKISFPLQIEFCKNDSLITRARNNLIAKAMNDETITNIMFIDSDITWNPMDILKLILSSKPFIGGVYPLKKYHWTNIVNIDKNKEYLDRKNKSHLKDIISDEIAQRSTLLKYNVNFLSNPTPIENNLAKVRHIATGFMMIQRNVIETMMTQYPNTKYTDDVGFLTMDENKFAYALFDCGVEDNHYLSEDWMFCHRWNKLENEIFIDVSIDLVHSGIEDYRGSFISSFV